MCGLRELTQKTAYEGKVTADINVARFSGAVDHIQEIRDSEDFLRFTMRITGRFGGRERTYFPRICVIAPALRAVANRLSVGDRVIVEGHLETFPKGEDGDGWEIVAEWVVIPDREATIG